MTIATTQVEGMKKIDLLTCTNLNDGRYALTFRSRASGNTSAYKHWTNVVTSRGLGAIMAEMPEAAREAWAG